MRKFVFAVTILAVLLAATAAQATTIKYTLTSLGGSDYCYDWLVINNPLSVDIEDFVIFFSDVIVPEATNLAVAADVTNWTEDVQPPSGGPTGLAGYYEAWSDSGFGIAPGDSLGGFAASFTWTGPTSGPGSQYFEVYDASWNVIDSGYTVPIGEPVIPEWGSLSLALFALGPISLAIRRRR